MTRPTSTYECNNASVKPPAPLTLATTTHGGKVHLAWATPVNGNHLLCGNPAPAGQILAHLSDDGREALAHTLLTVAVTADRLCRCCFTMRFRTEYTTLVQLLTGP
ncbi:hypothetical protein GCM10010466_39390 [Planomonospora alba]|uniref:Uncharacterized protein n=1 Tax=Planomonospora alba TaxID=161354 RepID=A0ABP6ND76_9ACTN